MKEKHLDEILEKFKIPHHFDKEYFDSIIERGHGNHGIHRFVDEIKFEGLDAKDLQERADKGARLLYSSNHRSHIDYLVLGYILAVNNAPFPRFGAGQNLLVWPVNKMMDFRKLGAFSIDRENKEYEYLKMLYTYIEDMLIGGEHILFFPEGGRSYNGDYVKPKTGLVRAVMGAIDKEKHKGKEVKVDVVPININYDKIAEKEVFNLLERAKKMPLIGKPLYYLFDIYSIEKRYFSKDKGNVYIKFGKPVDVRELGNNKKNVSDRIMELIRGLDK